MATYEHWYVDPGGDNSDGTTWAKAYTTLNAAEQAKDADITAATGSDKIVVFHCRSSNGNEDGASVTVDGWSTASGNYVVIVAEAINTSYPYDANAGSSETSGTGRHHGVFSDTHYRLTHTTTESFLVRENYVRLEGLQIYHSTASADFQKALSLGSQDATAVLYVSNCLVRHSANTDGYCDTGIDINDADLTVYIWNTIVYGLGLDSGTPSAANAAISINASTAVNIFGCTCIGAAYGIRASNGTVTIKNTYAYGSTDAFYGTFTATNCASSGASDLSTSGTGNINGVAHDTASGAYFTNVTPATADYHIGNASSQLTGAGATLTDDPPGSTALALDIDGETRS